MESPSVERPVGRAESLDLDARRGQITKRLLELEQETLSLKRAYNTMSPSCRLPIEILSRIFVDLRDLYMGRMPQEWFQVSYVCHYWREVATGCAALWTNVPFISSAFTDLALSRSKDAPLSLIYGQPGDRGTYQFHSTAKRILAHTTRLRIIDLMNVGLDWMECDAPFTSLEVLRFKLPPTMAPDVQGRDPLRFIQMGAPSLKELSLEEACGTPWSRLPLSESLTELRLAATPRDDQTNWVHIPSFEQLLASLAELVSLRKLKLSGYLAKPTQANHGDRPPASLHALQELHLKDSAHSVVSFLASIQLPNVTLVRLSLNGFEDVQLVQQALIVLKSSWKDCQRSHLVDLRSFKVKRDRQLALNRVLGSLPDRIEFNCGFAEGDGGPQRRLVLHVGSANQANDHSDTLLGAFTSELDFAHLDHLSIDNIEFFLTYDGWRALFIQLTHLKTITFAGCDELWGTFTTLLREGNHSSFLPSLSELSLKEMDIEEYSDGNTFSDLVSVLQKRSELGFCSPLKFSLLECYHFYRSFERLLQRSFANSSVSYHIVGDIS
ncbi:hypothetical protein D9611_002687 [Ephemerocybe angulata]|uniref:F-box domain-containing protein n=1 Tax=Ephemerocybe angulata TaxID=980116 RepID=A0A8H5C190_9AGAR|nr:hypothetical protein D9611_002687 [Tulosesus angulatus]